MIARQTDTPDFRIVKQKQAEFVPNFSSSIQVALIYGPPVAQGVVKL